MSPEFKIHFWLGPRHTRSCLALSGAMRKLRQDCYSEVGHPVPLTWPSRETPAWVAARISAPDGQTKEVFMELLVNHLSKDMKFLHEHLPRLFVTLDLPQLPKHLFRLSFGYGNHGKFYQLSLLSHEELIGTGTLELRELCDFVISILNCAAYDRRELPQGWDMTYGLPESPIRTVDELAVHLEQTRANLLQRFPAPFFKFVGSESEPLPPFVNDPEKYCRQIDNAHVTLAFWQTPNPPKQLSRATTIAESESQLSELIGWLRDFEANQEPSRDASTPSNDLASHGTDAPHVEYLPLESQILDALDGKSFKVAPLANALGVNSGRLYKKPWRGNAHQHVLGYMVAQQWIKHDPNLGGYYRPGFLPPRSLPKNPPKKNGR